MIRLSARTLPWLAGVWMLAWLGCAAEVAPGEEPCGTGACEPAPLLPTVRAVTPTALSAVPGELVRLSVSADDPNGGPLMFAWKASTGTLGVPVQTGNTSEVLWTALSCVPVGLRPTVEVTVTNAGGLSVRLRFEVAWNGPACGHPPCDVTLDSGVLSLKGDCTTDTPVFIPEGHTLEGFEHWIVARDPVGGAFKGAIVRNRGERTFVRNLKVKAQGLQKDGPCDGGEDRLRGILLQDATGSVTRTEVVDIRRNQRSEGNPEGTPRGCQEGIAIEVRNRDATVTKTVELRNNQVRGYQKGGILVTGRVNATVVENGVTGAGPVAHIAQNGLQLSDGATGEVTRNQVSGHAYTGSTDVASGILVAGGPYFGMALVRDALIQGNTVTGNDIGIYLDQAEADGSGPATATRIQVVGNTLRNEAVTNGYPYQAAISDLGGGNILHSNEISGAGYDPVTQPGATFAVDVVAGPASRVTFLTPARTVAAGACSGQVLVQSQDAGGNLSTASPAVFSLTASGGAASGLTFYADSACAGPMISAVELSTPEAAGAFFFKVAQTGTVALTVSNGSVSGTQEQTVVSF
ncbi:NosD domain-containing protein [Hyalangium minutum]|uniref:High-affinity leucine-specific transport system, periplasmic binding protein LivK n=1 Tax=Hyalangium minutum TaxID=394096 RepID=A0A085WL44_9BACT|nr:right-handed parallel beta-helix repeat-containing protein [Hyalangium minutum]KFE68407.1 High-affinity leucine-specific transport system, periplasmic binding protein LivK [Hyalangium minutum]